MIDFCYGKIYLYKKFKLTSILFTIPDSQMDSCQGCSEHSG